MLLAARYRQDYAVGLPFPHIVIDDFLPEPHARFLQKNFPGPEHSAWLDWKVRSSHQYGKLGVGDSSKFDLLEPSLELALQEFNSWRFLRFLEELTDIKKLIPDPYFTGGAVHQIISGGLLDIHTDFNKYDKLGLFRRLNVLIYLTDAWRDGYGGELELWDGGSGNGKCVRSIEPLFNRCVVFQTDKNSFHGHPNEWNAPNGITRQSVALYFYTSHFDPGMTYDGKTDWQDIADKPLPGC